MDKKRSAAQAGDDDGRRIFLRPSPQLHAYLDQVVATGLHGSNPTEAAMSMIRRGIEDLVKLGMIRPIKS